MESPPPPAEPPMVNDPMARHESFLFLMRDEKESMDRLGMPAATFFFLGHVGNVEDVLNSLRDL